ncbi:hypothetical protein V5S96_09800 [Corynebacterium mastitidis]|uniref:Uncharacterized protein n=1 Tax=Corynebacterium mastitidis TaxID=161890 RepID=A0ABU8P0M5_9CORY
MKLSLRLTTAAVAATAALSAPAIAGASDFEEGTFAAAPDETYQSTTSPMILSPLGQEAQCENGDLSGTCKQVAPDGTWTALRSFGPVKVYPVWEDPQPLYPFLPGGREVAERLTYIYSQWVGPYGRQGIWFEPATWDYIING